MKVVFASNNTGKIRELQNFLLAYDLDIIPQSHFNVNEIEEKGLTFVENALIKARHACSVTGLPAIADDSGLQVDALQGLPGIYSARYAGKDATALMNIEKLLDALQYVPPTERTASFHCTLVYMAHQQDPTPLICQANWSGSILQAPDGVEGFGYDPIFYVPDEHTSAAALPVELKNAISHRGLALRMLMEKLPDKLQHF